jgi:subtilisin family serine protease
MRARRRRGPRALLIAAVATVAIALCLPATGAARAPALRLPEHPAPIGVLPSDLIDLATDPARATDAVPVSIAVADARGRAAVERLVVRLGGTVRAAARTTIEASVPAGSLAGLGTDRGVASVRSLDRPFWRLATTRVAQTVGANTWSEAGVGGAGVKIGVIDEFEGIEDLLGETIPNRVHVRCYPYSWQGSSGILTTPEACEDRWSGPHGTAVAETIASIAPEAELFLAEPYTSLQLMDAIDWFAAEGVRIVNASFGAAATFEGPGDGSYDEEDLTFYAFVDHAVSHGMLWVNAAGNGDHGVYEAMFDGGSGNTALHDFAAGADTNRIWLDEDEWAYVALRWEDSWETPRTDLDLVLYSPDGVVDVADSDDSNAETGEPVEALVHVAQNSGWYRIGVSRWDGPPARFELSASTTLEFRTDSPSLPSPVDSRNPGAIAAGAVRVGTPDFVEWFSSHGPTRDGRQKPDLVAPDCGTTETYDPFCGTSQSAPSTVGVAALLLAADPTLDGPVALAEALRAATVPVPHAEPREVGAGLVHLGQPPAAVPAPPERLDLSLDLPEKPVTYGSRVTARVGAPPEAAGRRVAIEAWRDGEWVRLAVATVRRDGTADVTWTPKRADLVRAHLVPATDLSDGESEPGAVGLVARISVVADPAGRDIAANTVVRYTVTVDPPVPTGSVESGALGAVVVVRFGNAWKLVDSLSPTAGSARTWTFDVRWTRGLWRVFFLWQPPTPLGIDIAATEWREVNAK